MSQILDFYRGGEDVKGRTLASMLYWWSDHRWDSDHDFIQWVFPTRTKSAFNHQAPVLTEDDVEAFASSEALQTKVLGSYFRFRKFLALSPHIGKGFVDDAWWVGPRNHNMLRITRVLDCLTTVGLRDVAEGFFSSDLCQIHTTYRKDVQDSFPFWEAAVKRPILGLGDM